MSRPESTVQTKLGETDSTDQTTIETRNGGAEERCPTCGNWYEILTSHWSRSSCPYPSISEYRWELMKGMMLGDGGVDRSGTNPYVEFYNTNKTFLEWLSNKLGWITTEVRRKKTAVESSQDTRKTLGRDTQPEDCVDCYRCPTRCMPIFDEFASWYNTGEIRFPRDLSVSPTSLRMWYVSDGGFNWGSTNPRVKFASHNESERPEAIINALEEHGFTVGHSNESFQLSTDNTEDFFDLIGHDPVAGFEYKWAWRDEDRYHRLKDWGRGVHHTQTLDPDQS